MPDGQLNLTHQKLKTPRAAALAGILFTVLFSSSVVLIRLSIPADPADAGTWLKDRAGTVSLALSLLPFAPADPSAPYWHGPRARLGVNAQ